MTPDDRLQRGPPLPDACRDADDRERFVPSGRMTGPRLRLVRDRDHLRILSVLYYVGASVLAFLASFGFVVVAVGIRGAVAEAGRRGPDADFNVFLIVHGGLVVLVGWICALVLFCTGRNLAWRRQFWACFLVACYLCLVLPLLGVPTLVVLTRPGVKESFAPPRKGWPLSIFG